jgi:sorting nexin-1/2
LRRVVCNPELKDTECLLVFLGGGDDEFKKAKKDGSFGSSKAAPNAEPAATGAVDESYPPFDPEMAPGAHYNSQHDYNKLIDKVEEELSTKKAGIKKWIKERKTSLKGTMVRSPDDAIFDEITNYISALEMGLKRIDTQTSSLIRRDKDVSTCMLEFGLGCEALCHIDDEINGVVCEEDDTTISTGIGQTFRQMGKTADEISKLSYEYYEKELSCFREPLRDHLKMIHAVKIALQKRHNRRVTYSTCINAVESKKASVHKYKITPGKEGKSVDAAASLARAEATVIVAKQNYEECSQRVLREVDRFRKENASYMYATMLEFAKVQKEHHDKMNNAWGALVPQLEGLDASDSALGGKSFVEASAAASKSSVERDVEAVTADVQNIAMPSYPPPPEPTSNAMESSVLNEAVRYRTVDPLPAEE